jgi:hypothetical protein
MSDDHDFPGRNDFLADARLDFREFYLLASAEDELLMDGLVMLHAALVVGLNTPRDFVPPVVRDGVERTCDKVEKSFTEFREAVRACPTFQRVSDGERSAIEKVAFAVRVPGSE